MPKYVDTLSTKTIEINQLWHIVSQEGIHSLFTNLYINHKLSTNNVKIYVVVHFSHSTESAQKMGAPMNILLAYMHSYK